MANESREEVVLVTGGSGFLGQHVVKHLLTDETVKEIRILDKLRFENDLSLAGTETLVSFEADLCDKEKCRDALRGVDVVLHCAALVSYEFPPEVDDLVRDNVTATQNLVELCIEEGIDRLVHCSSTEVTLQSCIPGGIVAMVVYSQESRAQPPKDEKKLIFGEYAASKLRAEKIALAANGRELKNGSGIFRTVALRPPLLYGEGDVKLVWEILRVAKSRGNSLVKLAGVGGKQQMAYVGNVAWAFICAKKALSISPEKVGGLPVFVTDDTTVENLFRFCERLTRDSDHHIILSWSIPSPISYLCAIIAEYIINHFPHSMTIGEKKIPVSPRALVSYLGSIILYNRTRAAININYSPIYDRKESLRLSWNYYSKIFDI